MVKNPPAIRETWIRSLGWEDPLEEGMATHSSILAWKIPWGEEPGRLLSLVSQRVDMTEQLSPAQQSLRFNSIVVRKQPLYYLNPLNFIEIHVVSL